LVISGFIVLHSVSRGLTSDQMEGVMCIISALNTQVLSGFFKKVLLLHLAVAVFLGMPWAGIAPAMAEKQEVWVDDDYCNGCPNGGHAWNIDAFAKIQDGINAAGSTVNVMPGTYLENIEMKPGMIIRGAGSETTIIDGNGNGSVVKAAGALEGFTIRNGAGTSKEDGYTYGGGLYISNSTFVLKNCVVTGNKATNGSGGLEVYGSSVTVLNCDISRNSGWWGGAIALHDSSASISGTRIDNNELGYGGAVFLTDSSQATIVNSRITRSSLGIGIGESSTATVVNSTLAKNHSGIATGVYMLNNQAGSVVIKNSILWANGDDLSGEADRFTVTYSDTEFGWPGQGNISSNPFFVDPENGDYRLKDYSSCIGKGTPDGAPDTDIQGNPRPVPAGSSPDLGAYENTRGLPATAPPDLAPTPVRLTSTIAAPDMAVSDEGRIAVVWANTSNPDVEEGLYCAVKSPDGEWTREELVHAGWWIEDPKVVFDGDETIHALWQGRMDDGTAGILYASKPKEGAWSTPVKISDGPSLSPALAVDSDNGIHAVWVGIHSVYELGSDIVYVHKSLGAPWDPAVNLSGSPATESKKPDIAVSTENQVWVAWEEAGGGIFHVSKSSGEGWSEPAVLSAEGSSPKMIPGEDGAMLAAWENSGGAYSTRPAGESWSEPVSIPVNSLYPWNVVFNSKRETLHVVEIRGGGIFDLYSCRGSMWFSELLFPVDWVSDSSAASALGPDGRLHVSWFRREWTSHGVWVGEYLPPTDSDGDCLFDQTEALLATDPKDIDTDDDGVSDGHEDKNHNSVVDGDETDPLNPDTDVDGIWDGVELGIAVAQADPDGEGPLRGTDGAVFKPDLDPTFATDPLNPDTDDDGVNDGEEDLNRNGRFDPGETDPLWKPLDIFGLALGNKWTYQGIRNGRPLIVEREVTAFDEHSFPVPVYVISIRENGVFIGSETVEHAGDRIKLRGVTVEDEGNFINLRFDAGLPMAWYPMAVTDPPVKTSSRAVFDEAPDYACTVALDAGVLGRESVTLGFGTVDTFKVRYVLSVKCLSEPEERDQFDWWITPYIGVVKDRDAESSVTLTAFAIGGGVITEKSDADGDGLSDYNEIFLYNTHWKSPDTDNDGCTDGLEITVGRDPLSIDPQGDVNGDCAVDIKDAVEALRIISMIPGASAMDLQGDATGDEKIGLEDVAFVLQKVAGQR
jgi:hypothetical protein